MKEDDYEFRSSTYHRVGNRGVGGGRGNKTESKNVGVLISFLQDLKDRLPRSVYMREVSDRESDGFKEETNGVTRGRLSPECGECLPCLSTHRKIPG